MRYVCKLLALTAMVALVTSPARADLFLKAIETGGNVVFSGAGTADLTDLAFGGSVATVSRLDPSLASAVMNIGFVDAYSTMSGPTNFGSGLNGDSDSSSGDIFGVVGYQGFLVVPKNYVSGGILAGTMTFNGQTFASLGVTPGTYVWNWGSGNHADSFTLQIGSAAIPEPGSFSLCAAGGLLGLILLRRRRNRAIA